MDTITVRQMPFEFPDEIDPVFIEGDPELSFEGMSTGYAMIASSLLLPQATAPAAIKRPSAPYNHLLRPFIVMISSSSRRQPTSLDLCSSNSGVELII